MHTKNRHMLNQIVDALIARNWTDNVFILLMNANIIHLKYKLYKYAFVSFPVLRWIEHILNSFIFLIHWIEMSETAWFCYFHQTREILKNIYFCSHQG